MEEGRGDRQARSLMCEGGVLVFLSPGAMAVNRAHGQVIWGGRWGHEKARIPWGIRAWRWKGRGYQPSGFLTLSGLVPQSLPKTSTRRVPFFSMHL